MDWLRQLRFRMLGLFRKKRLEAEMAEEMRAHLEFEAAARRAQGMNVEEARFAAQRTFGGAEQIRERCRDERSFVWLEQLVQDLRYAGRALAKNPGFTATIVLTLGLGIGANATIFSVVNTVLLEPLPYADIDRLVNLRETRPLAGGSGRRVPVPVSPATFFDWRNGVGSFEEMAAVLPIEYTFTGGAEPEQLAAAVTTANLFPMLGVVPRLGRNFRPEENSPGAPAVALLSHAFWQRRFGANESAIGQAITLDGRPFTIIGVLPAWFDDTAAAGIARRMRPNVWTALTMVEAGALRSVPVFDVHARLRPDATLADAQSELDAVMQRLAKEFPATNAARGAQIQSIADRVVGDARPSLWVLFAAVGLVLLIACANVANLLLARATLRGTETAMRAALGASRSRLIRQFLTESLLLAFAGCALGLLVTAGSIDAFASFLPLSLPRVENIAVDGRVLSFTVLISLLTALAFGLLPATHAAKADLVTTIKAGGRGRGGAATMRLRNALIVSQVALSLVLLVGAGLLLKSFVALTAIDPGFDHRGVLTLRISLPGAKYRTLGQLTAFFEQLTRQARTLPNVESAAMVFPLPFSGPILNAPIAISGRPADLAVELSAECNIVSPDYFRGLGIRITQGRAFTEEDRSDAPPVAMVNETLARRIWPGENPIGKRISIGKGRVDEREVVGVFADIKQRELDSDPLLQVCVPHGQQSMRTMYLALRGEVTVAGLLPAIRQRITELDKDVPFTDVALWSERVTGSIAPRRVATWMLAVFAGAALLLAVVGIYGVMSYLVAQRTREFGIRVALGARWWDLQRMVLGQGMRLVALGVTIGFVVALGLSRVLAARLFQISATDPGTFAAVAFILVLAAAAACWLPARRAAQADPITALRTE